MTDAVKIYNMKALTDIWTGDIDRKPNRTINTGLLGSVRWWFEVLVRGMGGHACDPSDTKCDRQNHCVVCELFGCTGWARKFRFDVLDKSGCIKTGQIKKDDEFKLQFTPLRFIQDEEWALLDATIRLIADFGAIGGKTVYKPSDEEGRGGCSHHKDYGLIENVSTPAGNPIMGQQALEKYIRDKRWLHVSHNEFAWASLKNFWFVNGRYLARENTDKSSFNRVIGRKEEKIRAKSLIEENKKWLTGGTGESKKVFSFKKPAQTFGFVKPNIITHEQMKQRLREVWPDIQNTEYLDANVILKKLITGWEAS